jgi:hypothetical protein
MNGNKFGALLKSRRFWIALFGAVGVAVNELWGISPGTTEPIAAIAIAWIVGDSLRKTE